MKEALLNCIQQTIKQQQQQQQQQSDSPDNSNNNNNDAYDITVWIRLQSYRGRAMGDLFQFIEHVLPQWGNVSVNLDVITTDGDSSAPRDIINAEKLLSAPYVRNWYTQNYDTTNQREVPPRSSNDTNNINNNSNKVQPLPIGLDLHTIATQKRWSTEQVLDRMLEIRNAAPAITNRTTDFWMPPMAYNSKSRGMARQQAMRCLNPINGRDSGGRLDPFDLFQRYTKYRFGISPPGNGMDCHRTWEMLFMGMIPIVESSSLDALYQKFDLPVVIVKNKDWSDLCRPGFLDAHFERLSPQLPMKNEQFTTAYYLTQKSAVTEKKVTDSEMFST